MTLAVKHFYSQYAVCRFAVRLNLCGSESGHQAQALGERLEVSIGIEKWDTPLNRTHRNDAVRSLSNSYATAAEYSIIRSSKTVNPRSNDFAVW